MKYFSLLIFFCFLTLACSPEQKNENNVSQRSKGCLTSGIDSELLRRAEKNLSFPRRLESMKIKKRLLWKYGFKEKSPDAFLHILCEEYKDHQKILRRKIELLANIHAVLEGPQEYSEKKPLWSQLTAEGYRQLVFLHKHLAYFRSKKASTFSKGKITPRALPMCEMKFILKNYLAKQRGIWDLSDWMEYEKGLKIFLKRRDSCSEDERSTIANFRGDGSLRPHLMEASAMETYAYIVAKLCAKDSRPACLEYHSTPYASRLKLNTELLRALFFYNKSYESYFSNARYPVFLLPDSNDDGAADYIFADETVPNWKELYGRTAHNFAFSLIGKYRVSKMEYMKRKNIVLSYLNDTLDGKNNDLHYVTANLWKKEFATRADLGISTLFDLTTAKGQESLRKRIEVSLHRHADFYRTFHYIRDLGVLSASISPWSSSSYYINQSHKFTVKGYASDTMADERYNWMQIYKIPDEKLYTGEDLKAGKSPHLLNMWIKEPDFGSNRLASEELALDHFAMPEADELEALLWLGHVKPTSEMMEIVRSEGNS